MSRRDPSSAAELVAGTPGEGPGGLAIVKDWIRSALLDNLALKAVAFLLALTLFILVHSDEDEIIPVTVKLTYAAPRDGLTLVQEPPPTVRVSIKGSRRRLRRLVESELDPIQVTLTNTGEFFFQSDMIRPLPEGLSVASISPQSISLVYERTKDKNVAVRVRTAGRVAPGYRVQSVTSEPAMLDVRGAESALARLSELVTQPVSIEGATGNVEAEIALAVPPFPVRVAFGDKLDPPQEHEVKVVVEIVPAQGLSRLESAPIEVRGAEGVAGDVSSAWTVEPAQVTLELRGDQLVLDSIKREAVSVFVWVYPADAVARVGRKATVEVVGIPAGVAIEMKPRTVALTPK